MDFIDELCSPQGFCLFGWFFCTIACNWFGKRQEMASKFVPSLPLPLWRSLQPCPAVWSALFAIAWSGCEGSILSHSSILTRSIRCLAINCADGELQHFSGHRPAHVNVCAWLLWPLTRSEEFTWKLLLWLLSSAYEMLTMQWWLQIKHSDFFIRAFHNKCKLCP